MGVVLRLLLLLLVVMPMSALAKSTLAITKNRQTAFVSIIVSERSKAVSHHDDPVYHHHPSPLGVSYRRLLPLRQQQPQPADDQDSTIMAELSRRIQTLKAAEQVLQRQEQSKYETNNQTAGVTTNESSLLELPVLSMDALLPGQRLEGTTTDPTFGRLLREIGLGGLFVMTSLNPSSRRIRRHGVMVQIKVVDAPYYQNQNQVNRHPQSHSPSMGPSTPTAVDFVLVGQRPCRVVGPSQNMQVRIGRWRRAYDSEGEEAQLGWGMERFMDRTVNDEKTDDRTKLSEDKETSHTEWSLTTVELISQGRNETEDTDPNDLVRKAQSLIPLLDQWYELASNSQTYDNTDVVATARRRHGHAGLRVDPAALLRSVEKDLGPRPDPADLVLADAVFDFCVWSAALINPVPTPLGVSPEIRGRILDAPSNTQRLKILEWGITRSIRNLQGTQPL